MGSNRRRKVVRAVIAGVLALVVLVGGAILLVRWRSDDVFEEPSPEAAEAFCSTMDGDIQVVVDGLSGAVTDEERVAARSTVGWYFSDAFVDGAPAHQRDIAEQLVDDVLHLRDTGEADGDLIERILVGFEELERAKGEVCSPA